MLSFKCYICIVKVLKSISVILFTMVFFISSSGVLIYKTHCSFSGNEKVAVFVEREACDLTSPQTANSSCHTCTTVNSHQQSTDCGCTSADITLIKLNTKVVIEDTPLIKVQAVQIFNGNLNVYSTHLTNYNHDTDFRLYIKPPPKIASSLSFLIETQQLRIPSLG